MIYYVIIINYHPKKLKLKKNDLNWVFTSLLLDNKIINEYKTNNKYWHFQVEIIIILNVKENT